MASGVRAPGHARATATIPRGIAEAEQGRQENELPSQVQPPSAFVSIDEERRALLARLRELSVSSELHATRPENERPSTQVKIEPLSAPRRLSLPPPGSSSKLPIKAEGATEGDELLQQRLLEQHLAIHDLQTRLDASTSAQQQTLELQRLQLATLSGLHAKKAPDKQYDVPSSQIEALKCGLEPHEVDNFLATALPALYQRNRVLRGAIEMSDAAWALCHDKPELQDAVAWAAGQLSAMIDRSTESGKAFANLLIDSHPEALESAREFVKQVRARKIPSAGPQGRQRVVTFNNTVFLRSGMSEDAVANGISEMRKMWSVLPPGERAREEDFLYRILESLPSGNAEWNLRVERMQDDLDMALAAGDTLPWTEEGLIARVGVMLSKKATKREANQLEGHPEGRGRGLDAVAEASLSATTAAPLSIGGSSASQSASSSSAR